MADDPPPPDLSLPAMPPPSPWVPPWLQSPAPDPTLTPQDGGELANALTGAPPPTQDPGTPSGEPGGAPSPSLGLAPLPPWATPPTAGPPTAAPPTAAPGEIQMPDDYVGAGPPAGADAMSGAPQGAALPPWAPAPAAAPQAAAPWTQALPQPGTDTGAPTTTPNIPTQAAQGGNVDYTTHPLDNPDAAQGQQQLMAMSLRDPIGYAAYQTQHQDQAKTWFDTRQAELDKKRLSDIQTDNQSFTAAMAKQSAAEADNRAQIQKLQNTVIQGPSIAKRVSGVVASLVGGLAAPYMGGKNAGLDAYNESVDRDIALQKANFENQKQVVGMTTQNLAAQRADLIENQKQGQLYKAAMFGALSDQLQHQAQNFDQKGTTALDIANHVQQAVGMQQMAKAAADKISFDQNQAKEKTAIEQQKANTEQAAEEAKAALERAKAGGRGAGAGAAADAMTPQQFHQLHPEIQTLPPAVDPVTNKPLTYTNKQFEAFYTTGKSGLETDKAVASAHAADSKGSTNYTESTGLADPYTKQPILSKTVLPADQVGKISDQLVAYQGVNEDYDKLAKLAAAGNSERSIGGQAWDRWKTTNEAEYDGIRTRLMAGLMHSFGERPNEASMEAQKDLVPDLNKLGGSKDVVKIIRDGQESADSKFARTMNVLQVDGDGVVKNAQRHRVADVQPNADDQITAANEALANAKTPAARADAQRAIDDAKTRAAGDAQTEASGKQAEGLAWLATPMPLVQTAPGAPADQVADAKVKNDAIDTYNQAIRQFHEVATAKKIDPVKFRAKAVALAQAKSAIGGAADELAHQQREHAKSLVFGPGMPGHGLF